MCIIVFFFVNQKTAYDMRISDWSSDVCSSDLLQNSQGATLVSLPLAFNLGDVQFPFDETVSEDGKTLTLKPNLDPASSKPKPVAAEFTPVASPDEDQKAIEKFQSQLGLATHIGSLTGTIVGAVIG